MARKRRGRPVNGWVVVDKPVGPTSTQVVGRVRRVFDRLDDDQAARVVEALRDLNEAIAAVAAEETD